MSETLFLKEFSFMFKEFRCPKNTDRVLSVHYFSPERLKITKGLMVDLSSKTIKFKQQMEFQKLTCGISFFFFFFFFFA